MAIESFSIDDESWNFHHELRSQHFPNCTRIAAPDHGRGYVLMHKNQPEAFLASFSSEHMLNTDKDTAIIGFYEAKTEHAGLTLLDHVVKEMKSCGKTSLIGPMNQNTWGQYRFVFPSTHTSDSASPTFLGDVIHHDSYPQHFINFGFSPISFYESRANYDLTTRHSKRREIEDALRDRGITIDAIDMKCFDETLAAIFSLSLLGFSRNKFYAPISYSYFASLYKGIESIIDPDLFLIARNREREIVGFIFAYRDPLSDEPRAILKSMTIDDKVRGIGLGFYLMDEIQRIAHEKHFAMAIHALMYSGNTTKGISEGAMKSALFKRYALFQKLL